MILFLFRGILRDKPRFLFPFPVVTIGVALVVSLVGFMEGVFMGMIDTGLFFAITGLLLLLGGVSFERIRRRLLDRFDLNEG